MFHLQYVVYSRVDAYLLLYSFRQYKHNIVHSHNHLQSKQPFESVTSMFRVDDETNACVARMFCIYFFLNIAI